jgi:drug/metabolite transporter (DMT)-like permease
MNTISKGIIYILVATFSFAIMNAMAKELSGMHPLQVVFLRAFGSFVFIFPFMLYRRISIVGNNPKLLLARALVGVVSLATFFMALQRIPLGSAVSIRYLGPIFGAVLAWFYLKEKVSTWQWLSFAVAFSGVIVIKGFDLRIDYLSLGLVLTSAFFLGMVFVLIRYLSDKEHFLTIINYFMVVCMLVGLCFVSYWRFPLPHEWRSVIGIGIFGLFGQVFMTIAFKYSEASVLAPFKYMELVYALIMGYVFFGEGYTLLPMLGIVLIIAGMVMNIYGKEKKTTPETAGIAKPK